MVDRERRKRTLDLKESTHVECIVFIDART